jgi:hypothetical protein
LVNAGRTAVGTDWDVGKKCSGAAMIGQFMLFGRHFSSTLQRGLQVQKTGGDIGGLPTAQEGFSTPRGF